MTLPQYKCSQCEYNHNQRKYVLHHMWTVHLIDCNTHICPCCNYFTENQKKIRHHIKQIHKVSHNFKKCNIN
jgi:hypothetical protein